MIKTKSELQSYQRQNSHLCDYHVENEGKKNEGKSKDEGKMRRMIPVAMKRCKMRQNLNLKRI